MQLVPENYEYDLTDDLEPGWQTMEVLKQWTKEVTTRDSSGTATYFVVEFGSQVAKVRSIEEHTQTKKRSK